MANINMFRGGTPDFKGWFCRGDWPEFKPPFSAPHAAFTPPSDSHADAAYGQGYLNLHFPLVPNLADTYGHKWMRTALKKVSAVGDTIMLNWVPLRSWVEAIHFEVTTTDKNLEGVYIKPCAMRVSWDFATDDWKYEENADFDTALTNNGITQFPLGTPKEGDKLWGLARLGMPEVASVSTSTVKGGPGNVTGVDTKTDSKALGAVPCTFGHNLVKYDNQGNATGGLDEYYGAVLLGYKFVAGDAERLKLVWKSNIAVYMSAKLFAFEGSTQVG